MEAHPGRIIRAAMAANRTLYLITCDLRGAIDYEPFLDELRQRLEAKEILRSQWVVGSSLDPMEIRDRLRTHLGPEDGLLIVEIGRWASDNTFVNINEVD